MSSGQESSATAASSSTKPFHSSSSSSSHPLLTLQALTPSTAAVNAVQVVISAPPHQTSASGNSAGSTDEENPTATGGEGERAGAPSSSSAEANKHPFQARQGRFEELCRSLNLDAETRLIAWDLLHRLTLSAGQQDEVCCFSAVCSAVGCALTPSLRAGTLCALYVGMRAVRCGHA